MQYMRTWVEGLGYKRDEVLQRLTREAVRAHRNVRGSDGGAAQTQGSFAYNEGIQAQQTIQGYAQAIPGVSQAQSLLNRVSGGPGNRREGPGEGFSPPVTEGRYPRPGSPPQGGIGGAPSFPGVSSQYARPSSPPSQNMSSYGPSSGYARPSSPPSFPGTARPSSHGSAYAPAYVNSGSGGRGPSFPDTSGARSDYNLNTGAGGRGPSFPDASGPRSDYTGSGYAPAYMNTSPGGRGPSFPEASGLGSNYQPNKIPSYVPPSSSGYGPSEGYSRMGFPGADVPSGRHGPGFPDVPAYGGQDNEFRIPSPGRGNRNEQYQYGHHNQPQHRRGGTPGDRY